MNKIIKSVFFVIPALLLPSVGFAQTTIFGGRGLLRSFSAETIGKSQFYANSFFLTFLQSKRSQSTLGKDHTMSIGLTLGVGKSIELTGLITPYQDDQVTIWGPPGDSQLGLKFITPFSSHSIYSAVRVFANFPTAKKSNVPFEPYRSGELGIGGMGIITFDMTESFPLFALKANINLGYFDQNFRDELFNGSEDQYLLGIGFKFPVRSSILYTEYTAEIFANNNVPFNQNPQRITEGLKVLGPWNLIIDFAFDFSVSKKPKVIDYVFYKEYAAWKAIVGINYQLVTKSNRYVNDPRKNATQKKPANDKVYQEVQQKRENVQTELKRMEESLENDGKKKDKSDKDKP